MIQIDQAYKKYVLSGSDFVLVDGTVNNTTKTVYKAGEGVPVIGTPGWQNPISAWDTALFALSTDTVFVSSFTTLDEFTSGSIFTSNGTNSLVSGSEFILLSSTTPTVFEAIFRADSSLNGTLTSDIGGSGTIDYSTNTWTVNISPTAIETGGIQTSAYEYQGKKLGSSPLVKWNYTTPSTATYAATANYNDLYTIDTYFHPSGLSVDNTLLSGGVEFINFHFETPGEKTITAEASGIVSGVVNYTYDIKEISGLVIDNTSNIDEWTMTVSATEWSDKGLDADDILSWTVYGNQGFISAYYQPSGPIYFTSTETTTVVGPTATVGASDIDHIKFYYNTPGVKTVKASKINPANGEEYVSTNVLYVSSVSPNVTFDLPTLSSENFYSSGLEIQQDAADYVNRTADITLRGKYGDTYGSKTLFTIPGDKVIQWDVDTTTGLSVKNALGDPISLPTFGSAYTLSSLELSSTDQSAYVISGFYYNETANYDEYDFVTNFEPSNVFIDYSFNNCPFTRSLTATAKTLVGGTEYDVQGGWNIKWLVEDSTNIWSATKPDGVTYNIGNTLPVDDIGTIIFSVTPESSATPESLSADLKLIYTTSVSAVSTINFDQYPDETIFDVDAQMNMELASHSNFNGMWRVSSSDWAGSYTANLSAFLNDSLADVGDANNYQWTFGDGSSDTGVEVTKVFDTTTLPTVCSITLAVSCLSATPEFIFPHTKSVTFDLNLVTVLPSAEAFIYPKYGWYDKLYRFVDLVTPLSARFANEIITYGEGDTPEMWLSASNNGEVGITNVWWMSGGINNDYKTTGGKGSWEVPETCVGCTTGYYTIPVLLGVFDATTSQSMASSYFDDDTGTETIYGNFSEHVIKINGYDTPEVEVSVTSKTDNTGVTIDAAQTTTFADSAADISIGSTADYLWILSGANHYIEQLNDSQFILTSGVSFGDAYNIQVSANLPEYINQTYGGEWLSSNRVVVSPQLSFEPISVFFNISANEPYTVYETGTIPLTGFVPFVGVGNLSTTLNQDFTATWVVESDTYVAAPSATLSPWTCSYLISGGKPYNKDDYTSEETTIFCSVTDSTGTVGSIERTMSTRTPPAAFLDVYPVNKYVVVDEPTKIINLSRTTLPFIPISAYMWSNGYNTSATYYDNQPFVTTYPENGNQSVLLSAIDNKSFLTNSIFLAEVIVLDDWVDFDPDIIRSSTVPLELPQQLKDIHMPPNEFVTDDNIDVVFRKLDENLDYIDKISKIYDVPPIDYLGWLGKDSTDTTNVWHIKDVDSNYSDLSGSNGFTQINDVTVRSDGLICIADDTQVRILSGNYLATELDQITRVTIGDDFAEVTAVDTDNRDRIFVLDKLNNKVSIFEYDLDNIEPLRMLSNWGGLGGPGALNSYNFPNDLMIHNNEIWITDTGNGVIKRYSNTGNWLGVYSSEYFSANINTETGTPLAGSPISTAIDRSGNIHVLTSEYVVKLDPNGNFLMTYEYGSTATPQKIFASPDDGMMYIVVSDSVIKITDNGTYIGILGDNDLNYTPTFTSVLHDENRNLYVCDTKHLLLYVDYIKILGSRINTGVVWNDVSVDKNEFTQDWVYNKTFHRFWDNMEYMRKSLYGKVVEVTEDGITRLTTSPRTTEEWPEFTYNKTNIVIGVNEFCSAPVINRLIDQSYDCLETLLEMVDIRE